MMSTVATLEATDLDVSITGGRVSMNADVDGTCYLQTPGVEPLQHGQTVTAVGSDRAIDIELGVTGFSRLPVKGHRRRSRARVSDSPRELYELLYIELEDLIPETHQTNNMSDR